MKGNGTTGEGPQVVTIGMFHVEQDFAPDARTTTGPAAYHPTRASNLHGLYPNNFMGARWNAPARPIRRENYGLRVTSYELRNIRTGGRSGRRRGPSPTATAPQRTCHDVAC